jgi:hypothetical protein
MSDIFVEQRDGAYVALQNHRVIARGDTQAATADRAHKLRPSDPVFVERVRMTKGGSRDQWRRVY